MTIKTNWSKCRRGMATIEVALCVMVLAVPLSAMFMILAYVYSASGLAVVARHRVWEGRHRPWESQPHVDLVSMGEVANASYDRILGPGPRLDPNEVLTTEVSKEASIFGVDTEILTQHYLFGGTWDHWEIPFERHRRLMPSRKFAIFTQAQEDWSRFSSLAAFAGSSLAAQSHRNRAQYDTTGHRSGRGDGNLRRQVDGEIVLQETEQRSIQQRIRDLEQDDEADRDLLSELRRRLREVESRLAKLRTARENLGNAENVRPR